MSETTAQQRIHKLVIPTNLNGKLHCNCMLHIDKEPGVRIGQRQLDAFTIEIHTADGSHPPTQWKLIDLIRLELFRIPTSLTWHSHGMDMFEFAKEFISKNADASTTTPMAVYFYQRVF